MGCIRSSQIEGDAGMIPASLRSLALVLITLLATMPSKVFSRDAIIDWLRGPGFAVTDRTIDSHVRNLRAKFAKAGCDDLIETRPGIGYRLGGCG